MTNYLSFDPKIKETSGSGKKKIKPADKGQSGRRLKGRIEHKLPKKPRDQKKEAREHRKRKFVGKSAKKTLQNPSKVRKKERRGRGLG